MKRNTPGRGFCGWGIARRLIGEAADLILVNSCTVTAESEAKSRKIIRRLAKKNPLRRDYRDGLLCHAGAGRSGVVARRGEVIRDKRELPRLLARRGL